MVSVPYQNVVPKPVIRVPHDQYSYINTLMPYLFSMSEGIQTLWLLPGGSMDVLLGLYNNRPDLLDSININVIEVNNNLYEAYCLLRDDSKEFLSANRSNDGTYQDVRSVYLLHSLLNKPNIKLHKCESTIKRFLSDEMVTRDDNLLFVNLSTRENQQEFSGPMLLDIAFDRLSMKDHKQPTILGGCCSNDLNRELEGSSSKSEKLEVSRYMTPDISSHSLLSVYSYY